MRTKAVPMGKMGTVGPLKKIAFFGGVAAVVVGSINIDGHRRCVPGRGHGV